METKNIGNKITEARKKLNISQAQLAENLFIIAQAVGKWERGESMPDIITLNRLAEILGVDLNYFSDRFQTSVSEKSTLENSEKFSGIQQKNKEWDLSKLSLVDSDFSGLKNLHEKLSSTNIQKCLFIGSEISGLTLSNNNVSNCDFTNSNITNSKILNSILSKNIFNKCLLTNSVFSKSYLENCNFTQADLSGVEFNMGGFGNNIILNAKLKGTSFIEMGMQDIVFEGIIEDCRFENCSFYHVKFQNATILKTFFKNNKKFKRVKFENCKVDKLTFAFLKNNLADMTGITLIP